MDTITIDNLKKFLEITGISAPPLGIYDVADPAPFAPSTEPDYCIFEAYESWLEGRSTIISNETAQAFRCPGAGYWMCGIAAVPQESVVEYLVGAEGLKDKPETMHQWLERHPPYEIEKKALVISSMLSPAAQDHLADIKTATFFVDPDQLSLLVTGAEYRNGSPDRKFVEVPYGSGCGQMLNLLREYNEPKAVVGGTDIAVRKHLPASMLTFTVTRPMLEQLLSLDDSSFLHKTFWNELKANRADPLASFL